MTLRPPRLYPSRRLLPLLLAGFAAGCTDGDKDGYLRLEDANNYSYVNTVLGEASSLKDKFDVTFDWSALDTDIQGHAVDAAADIDLLTLVHFRDDLTLDDIKTAISEDALTSPMTSGIVQFENDRAGTDCLVSEFSLIGNPIDVEANFTGGGIWMLRLTTGLNDTRALAFFELTPDGEEALYLGGADGAGASLDFQADLHSAAAIEASAGDEIESIEWSSVTKTAGGKDFNPNAVDRLIVGRYEGLSVTDLEADFFDVELVASEEWEATISGGATEIAVGDLASVADGSGFPGFQAGMYLVGMQYTIGTNPAPLYLSVVNIEE